MEFMKRNFFHVVLGRLIKMLLVCTLGILMGVWVFHSTSVVNLFFILGQIVNFLIVMTLIVSHLVYKKIDELINNGGK